MPTLHRPDFQALQLESMKQRRKRSRFRDPYMLPHINLEDLAKPKNLLLLLTPVDITSPTSLSIRILTRRTLAALAKPLSRIP